MKNNMLKRAGCLLLTVLTVLSLLAAVPLTAAADEAPKNPFACDGVPVKKLTVAGHDLSEYVIIHNDEPTYTDCAEHLARYLLSSTGIDVPLKLDTDTPVGQTEIRVGYTNRDTDRVSAARASLGEDGYLIMSEGSSLFISGATARGTCNGVYSFLEDHVGVRFFTRTLRPAVPADLVEIPGDLNVTYVPRFSYRRDNWPDTLDNWVCANKLNGNTGTMIGGGVGNVDYENKYGSVNFYSFTSTIGVWTETKGGTNKQPCLSDETNYQNALKNIRDALAHNPGHLVSVSPYDSDVNVGGCHCAACKAVNDAEGSEMATLLLFCNRLADDLKDEYPDVKIHTLAYHYTAKPPKTIKPDERVIVQFAPIQACYAHPLGKCDSSSYKSEESFAYLKEWAALCDRGNLWIWDYNAPFGYTLAPFTNYDVLYENVHTYASLGVGGVFMECVSSTELGQFTELNHYLLGKLLWDPDMTKEEYYRHMDEFLQAYYGDGWSYIRTYIDKLSARQASGHYGIWDDAAAVWHFDGSDADDSLMAELRGLWASALAAVPEDSEYCSHVEKSRIHALYADLCQQTQARCSLTAVSELRKLMQKYDVTSLGAHSTVGVAQVFNSIPSGANSDVYKERQDSPDVYYAMGPDELLGEASMINDCEMSQMTEEDVTFLRMTGKRDPYANYPNGTICLSQGARFVVLIYRSDKEQTGRMYSSITTLNGQIVTEQQDYALENTDGAFKCVLVEFTPEEARTANDFRFDPVDGAKIRNVSLDVAGLYFFFNEDAARSFIAAYEAGEIGTQPETEPGTEPDTMPETSAGSGSAADETAAPDAESDTGTQTGGCSSVTALPALLAAILIPLLAPVIGKRKHE